MDRHRTYGNSRHIGPAFVAVAFAAMLTVPTAWAAEPADDHAGGAGTLTPGNPVIAAIDRPGDRDWYAVKLTESDNFHVTVRRTAGGCAAAALRVTVLNPQAHAIRWTTVLPDAVAGRELPKNKAGRYLVEIDAQGEPGCGGLSYELALVRRLPLPMDSGGSGGSGSGASAKCSAARGQLSDDRRAQSKFKKLLKSNPKKAKRLLRQVEAALRQDRRDVSKFCKKKK